MFLRLLLSITLLFTLLPLNAQIIAHNDVKLSNYGIGTGNFSGITSLGNNRYALISDKEPQDGFFTFYIEQNHTNGAIENIFLENFRGNPTPKVNDEGISIRDTEGIAYNPHNNRIYICGEGDQQIIEYNYKGIPTQRRMTIPSLFDTTNIRANLGFESLCYDSLNHIFWTTTEATLLSDTPSGYFPINGPHRLRFQTFDDQLQPRNQYAYLTDIGMNIGPHRHYVYGVSDMCALPDGRLIVMEREIKIVKKYIGSITTTRLYLVDPTNTRSITSKTNLNTLPDTSFLPKKLIYTFTTRLRPLKNHFANYEGICLGAKLEDGRQTLLLINDSQSAAGKGPIHLHDFIKVLIL